LIEEATLLGREELAAKVPAITVGFWAIKILATTLGETAGDAVSMSMDLGYLASTGIFLTLFVATAAAQISARRFHPWLFWAVIIASTTVGTTLADYATRSLGIGYPGGSALLAALLAACILVWRLTTGTVAVSSVHGRQAETFYWLTIMLSQTLGTALGDWTADTAGLGYLGAAAIFGLMLAVILGLHLYSSLPKTILFWLAFVLTRPLGAVLGDFLDKPVAEGGLEWSRYTATAVLMAGIVLLVAWLPQRPAVRSH
jgi:uncharacterized membrane-anchored protein